MSPPEQPPQADLHCHTTCSDGTLSPEALVAAAVDVGLAAVALTDHDTVAGLGAALAAAESTGGALRLVPGIEISSRKGDREIHVLGLHVRPDDPGLRRLSRSQGEARERRAARILDRLRERGLGIDLDDVLAVAAGASVGRPHIAEVLVAHGHASSVAEAFGRWLGHGRVGDVPKEVVSTTEAIEAIHRAGGVAVVAHPGSTRLRESTVGSLRDAGLDGIEIRHPRHRRGDEERWRAVARRLELLPSGGSDFHGGGRGDAGLGSHGVPVSWCDRLERRAADHRRESPR